MVIWLSGLMLLLTLVGSSLDLYREGLVRDRWQFESNIDRSVTMLMARVNAYVAALRSVEGFLHSSSEVTLSTFLRFGEHLDLERFYPGADGIGVLTRFSPDQHAALVKKMRDEGIEDFHVWPAEKGSSDERTAVVYFYPFNQRTRAVLGFDMLSEPTRREAMIRARDSGEAVASGEVRLARQPREAEGAAFSIYLPLYRTSAPIGTVEEKRAALEGYAQASFRADDLFASIRREGGFESLDIEVYEGAPRLTDDILYGSSRVLPRVPPEFSPRFRETRRVQVAGREFTIEVRSRPEFELTPQRRQTKRELEATALISLLLMLITVVSSRSVARVEARISRSKEQLLREQAVKASIVDAVLDGVITVDDHLRIVDFNIAAERLLGCKRAAVVGRSIVEVLHFESLRGGVEEIGAAMASTALDQRVVGEVSPLSGKKFPAELSISRIPEAPQLFTLALRDISLQREIFEREALKLEIVSVLARSPSLPEASGEVLAAIGRACGFDAAGFWLHKGEAFLPHSSWALDREKNKSFLKYLQGSVGRAMQGVSALVSKASGWDKAIELIQCSSVPLVTQAIDAGFSFATCYPLGVSSPVKGVFIFFSSSSPRISRGMSETLSLLGSYLGEFVSRKDAEERLVKEVQTVQTLNKTGELLAGQFELDALVQQVIGLIAELVGGSISVLRLNASGENHGTLVGLAGISRDDQAQLDVGSLATLFNRVQDPLRPLAIDNLESDPRTHEVALLHALLERFQMRSALAVALSSRSGELLGEILVASPDAAGFSDQDRVIVAAVARQAAVALDNARLFAEARSAREAAETANKLKDEFLATVSHELRTPLNAILGYARLLQRKTPTPEALRSGLETIERNVRAQSRLINDLLDVSRIMAGKLRVQIEPVQLSDVVSLAVASVVPMAEMRGVTIKFEPASVLPLVKGDAQRLQQVVWNLLTNAIKFSPKGGTVRVTLSSVGTAVDLIVEDTGIGISPELLPQIFDRFRQIDSSTTRASGGLGLGLAIVKHIVQLHGGEVCAHSEGPGKGSTFAVRLPASAQAMVIEPKIAPSYPTASLEGVHILVVDDEKDSCEMLRELLVDSGASVATAASAAEAFDILKCHPRQFTLLLSDIAMPVEDGYSLLRRVRGLPVSQGGQIKAIALTAFTRAEDRNAALRAGFDNHLGKPVEPEQLLQVILSLVDPARQVA